MAELLLLRIEPSTALSLKLHFLEIFTSENHQYTQL